MNRPRRTLALEEDLDRARESGAQVVVSGPAVHDLLVDPDGRALYLPDLLRSWAGRRGLGLVVYAIGSAPATYDTLPGGRHVDLPHVAPGTPPDEVVRTLLEAVREQVEPAVVVVDYADLVVGSDEQMYPALAMLTQALQSLPSEPATWQRQGLQVVLVDRGGGLMARLRDQSGYTRLSVAPPDAAEAELFLGRKVQAQRRRLVLAGDLTPARAAVLGGGLQLRDYDELAATSSADAPVTQRDLAQRKALVIRQLSQDTLTLMSTEVTFGSDVAGMAALRRLLDGRRAIGHATVRLMLSGPPGSGKTYVASAVAAAMGVPMVSLGQIMGDLLGQAEHRMSLALAVLEAQAPVLLFVDESDQGALGRRDAGGRTSNEAYQAVRAMVFKFLSEPARDDGISVVATTNVPARLDPAAQSRFDFFPVLYSSAPELAQIMAIYARREGIPVAGDLFPVLADHLDGPVAIAGRRAQKVVLEAWTRARLDGAEALGAEHLRWALHRQIGHDWTPASEYSTLTSLLHASSADVLPWIAAAELGEDHPVPAYLARYLDADGMLRVETARERVRALEVDGVY